MDEAGEALTALFRRRVLLWVIRWIIGFAMVTAIVYTWPGATWLFWVAAAVAATSLTVMVSLYLVARRRIRAGKRRIREG